MKQLYNVNGLVFWSEKEIKTRQMVESHLVMAVKESLKTQNSAFEFFQVEAPLLTPRDLVAENYTNDDMFSTVCGLDNHGVPKALVLRPETTSGSYVYAMELLNTHNDMKVRMPLVVWQHGKSFRKEQDQPTKFMRLKEFYQLEFQIIYSNSTAKDYSLELIPAVAKALKQLVGETTVVDSDRIPAYAEWTKDVQHGEMELCSISKRKDYPDAQVLEVAVGTDRVVSRFLGM
jgi:glycyl-tRNA synthetase